MRCRPRSTTGRWHHTTGFAILGLTAVILVIVAMQLETKGNSASAPVDGTFAAAAKRGNGTWAFWSGVGLTCVLGIFFLANSRSAAASSAAPPSLTVLLPASAAGWEVRTPDDLYQFSGVLGTTHLLQRTYLRNGPNRNERLWLALVALVLVLGLVVLLAS